MSFSFKTSSRPRRLPRKKEKVFRLKYINQFYFLPLIIVCHLSIQPNWIYLKIEAKCLILNCVFHFLSSFFPNRFPFFLNLNLLVKSVFSFFFFSWPLSFFYLFFFFLVAFLVESVFSFFFTFLFSLLYSHLRNSKKTRNIK